MYAALCISNVSVRGWAGTKERRNQSLIPTRLHQPAPKNSTRARFQAEIPRCEWASLQEGRKEGPSREPPRSGKDVDGTWVGIRLQAGKPGYVDRIVDPANFQGPGVKGRRPAFGGRMIPARHQKAGGRGLVSSEEERENDCECAIDSRSQRLPASSVMVLL
jgi:hypothetical protein